MYRLKTFFSDYYYFDSGVEDRVNRYCEDHNVEIFQFRVERVNGGTNFHFVFKRVD